MHTLVCMLPLAPLGTPLRPGLSASSLFRPFQASRPCYPIKACLTQTSSRGPTALPNTPLLVQTIPGYPATATRFEDGPTPFFRSKFLWPSGRGRPLSLSANWRSPRQPQLRRSDCAELARFHLSAVEPDPVAGGPPVYRLVSIPPAPLCARASATCPTGPREASSVGPARSPGPEQFRFLSPSRRSGLPREIGEAVTSCRFLDQVQVSGSPRAAPAVRNVPVSAGP